ncbi:hypothetical protein GII33_04350 [Gordonia pseudamarae]|jgi:Mce-associated membrane protein|uniref:Twin-arginine translocation pathway signal n=1 Tax=Gordonia pseudamarae TaxID=2831662 RepID=A0ABX6IFW4_9ACTN|nr:MULTISPECIES: hypothetical protein [Gordonia]MBD0021712.1 hypothetical protein [Gordonia sp. (in: high G+C Gram-positive bacteria)]QHN25312.1 hypothetical protein GII33_04350 [Gordonia pseudamarae]QHN34244.1 hypothetical protein GII31_04345 [Gordonia pseudamarae]
MTITDVTGSDTAHDAAEPADQPATGGTPGQAGRDKESGGETSAAAANPEQKVAGAAGLWVRLRKNLTLLVAAVVMVAAVATVAAMYFTVYSDDQATGAATEREVLTEAKAGTTALLSYAPQTLDSDLAKGRAHLTGQFLQYYREFTDRVVKPKVQESQITTRALVSRAAVDRLSADSATVLVFLNQSTTSKEKPEAELTSSSVRIGMQREGGKWLISAFDPV